MRKISRLLLCAMGVLLAVSPTLLADTITWGGAGSQAAPEWWGNANNSDPTHWGQPDPPNMDGTDHIIINTGGIQKSYLNFTGGSTMTMNGGYFKTFQHAQLSDVNTRVIIGSGAVLESSDYFDVHYASGGNGAVFEIAGGTLRTTNAGTNPIRAYHGLNNGGYDFTALGGAMDFQNYTGTTDIETFLGTTKGAFWMIDGVRTNGIGQANAVNGKWLELTVHDANNATLTLVPEPATLALLASGGLCLLKRKRR